jgi:hypothetical protein
MQHTPNPEIIKLIQHAETAEDSREVATYNQILELGKKDGIVVTDRFYEWYRVCVSRFNREELIASGVEAADIYESIDGLGFDPSLIKDATAFQEGPSKTNVQPFMEKVEADPMLPRYDANLIEISSVACSHFNICLGQADQCMPHGNEKFTVDGKLNAERIKQIEPGMTKIIDKKGCTWTVWLFPAQEIYPGLMQLAQRAFNAKMNTSQGINNFELFSRSCTQLQNPTIRAKNEPKAFVMKNLAKLKTASSETELKDIVATAAKYGGIQLGPFTRHVSAYKKKARVVPAGVWSTIANTKFEHGDLCPHLLQSVLMACASCPEGVVTGKDLKLNMTKHKDDMLQIEEIIMVSIGMLKDMKLDRAVETKEVNLFRCSLVLKFLDKSSVQIAKATYFQVASDFYNACIAANKLDAQQKNPFERFRAIAESSSKDEADDNPPTKKAKKSGDVDIPGSHDDHVDNRIDSYVVQYDEDGKSKGIPKDILASKGFQSGVYVEKKKDKDGTTNK